MKKAVLPLSSTAAVAILTWFVLSILVPLSPSTMSTSFPSPSPNTTPTPIENSGSVKSVGVGVYWDSNCTDRVSSIDWGTVEPGSTRNVTVYVRNEGNVPVSLQLNTSNWSPVNASSFVGLSWEYGGESVGPMDVVEVVLVLSVAYKLDVSEFSFDILIVGRE